LEIAVKSEAQTSLPEAFERSQPMATMEPTKPKLPKEAIQRYNLFILGDLGRRDFIDGVKKLAIGGLAASTVLEMLMPNYALAQQVSKTDDRIKTSYETVPSPQGNGSIKGYLVRPVSGDTRNEKPTKLPGVIVVHENRGLNPHIEDIARRLALANFMAFAPDGLTSLGGFPGDDYKGGQMFSKVDGKKMAEDFVASANWLRARPDCSGKIGATGFCFGGGIANTLAVRLGPDIGAAVPFYGAVPSNDDIPKIKAAILVHHGQLDTRLAGTWPAYDKALTAINVPHEGYIYPNAVHGFNCDATPERYNKAAADLAWQRTIDWFNKYLATPATT
jgi:carboxymethylenebutenolidase